MTYDHFTRSVSLTIISSALFCVPQHRANADLLHPEVQEPRPDGSCPHLWDAKDSQGFCWNTQISATRANAGYAEMKAVGQTPPSPHPQRSERIERGAVAKQLSSNYEGCLTLQKINGGTCNNPAQSKPPIEAVKCVAVLASLSDPDVSALFDPNGDLCDKIKEHAGKKLGFEESAGAIVRAEGVIKAVVACAKSSSESVGQYTLKACSL